MMYSRQYFFSFEVEISPLLKSLSLKKDGLRNAFLICFSKASKEIHTVDTSPSHTETQM